MRKSVLPKAGYSVSHDLRTPLRAISGFSEALAEECGAALGGDGRHYLERVRAGVRRMGERIEGMEETLCCSALR